MRGKIIRRVDEKNCKNLYRVSQETVKKRERNKHKRENVNGHNEFSQ